MILGTASGVGKSLITAALCRFFSDVGYRVAPFKAQNMSNNSYVTEDGGEMGRAQAVQAECARLRPHTDMNPILLKPAADNCSQVVIQGKAVGHFDARSYFGERVLLERAIRDSYERLASQYEILVIEGAGSPAEVNLKEKDLVNMYVAEMADAKCLLVSDIDRGGVFASLLGTLDLLAREERDRIIGLIINKFRGDLSLFAPGIEFLEARSGKKVWGVLPYDRGLWIEEEDAVSVETNNNRRGEACLDPALDIAVILLPRMSNFTDFEVFRHEADVRLRYITRPHEIEGADLLILPGTKATISDWNYLAGQGFRERILQYVKEGGRILGICGGYQMMGAKICDPESVESEMREVEGLDLLHVVTEFMPEKKVEQVHLTLKLPLFGGLVAGTIQGYEIHMGITKHFEPYAPFGPDGAIHPSGRMAGTYLHGLWDSAQFRASFLEVLANDCGKKRALGEGRNLAAIKEGHYQHLADWLRGHLDTERLRTSLNLKGRTSIVCA